MTVYCNSKDPVHRSRPFQVSRLQCLLRPYEYCDECEHREFVVVVANVRAVVPCPIGKLAAEARATDLVLRLKQDNRLLAADVVCAMDANLDNCDMEKEVCKFQSLFYTCTSCKGDPDYDPRR